MENREIWRYFGVCGVCGWETPSGGSWVITGNMVAAHVGKAHPQSEGLVGYFYRRKVPVSEVKRVLSVVH